MKITKIVLTGGPCAGKSTARQWIQDEFSKLGYNVLFITESATEFIQSGLTFDFYDNMVQFETELAKMQIFKEQLYEDSAKLSDKKTLLVCDRGVLDCKAFITAEEFYQVMDAIGSNEVEERDKYDAVFHLVTAADGAEDAYTLDNNTARRETLEEARESDKKIIHAWVGHPHLRIIDNSTDFQGKMERLIKEIATFLGEPEPFEVERKFLIEYPDISMLESMPNCQKVEIVQIYLKSVEGIERRIRQRGMNGNYHYWITEKIPVDNGRRIEKESRISEREYSRLLMEADTSAKPVRKTRYCLLENNQYFEIDVYPDWQNQAIMEVELHDMNEDIHYPNMIRIKKEVTDDLSYTNRAVAFTGRLGDRK